MLKNAFYFTLKALLLLKIFNEMWWIFPDPFLKNQNWAYLWITIVKFPTVPFYGIPSWGLSEYIETKVQTTYYYLI